METVARDVDAVAAGIGAGVDVRAEMVLILKFMLIMPLVLRRFYLFIET